MGGEKKKKTISTRFALTVYGDGVVRQDVVVGGALLVGHRYLTQEPQSHVFGTARRIPADEYRSPLAGNRDFRSHHVERPVCKPPSL